MNLFLLVDDSENDFLLLEHAMKKSRVPAVLNRVHDLAAAMEYLQSGLDDEIDLPCAVLCDLRLNNDNGCELIQWMRQRPGLKDVPVLIWSGSQPIANCDLGKLGVQTVLNKPTDHGDFVAILETLQRLCDERELRANQRAG